MGCRWPALGLGHDHNTDSPGSRILARRLGMGRSRRHAARRRARRHRADAAGLESADADRSAITLSDHVDAICAAVEAAGRPVVLAVHSGTGFSGYAATDRVPERIAAMVYVDTAPGKGALDPDFEGSEKPFNWDEIAEEENLDGLSEEQLADVPRARGPGARWCPARGRGADERRSSRHPEHDHRDRLHVRGLPDLREGAPRMGVPRRHLGSARHHLGRPADEPLADVVAAEGARRDHRRRREWRIGHLTVDLGR